VNRELDWFTADMHQRTALRSRNAMGGVTVTYSDDTRPVQVHQTVGYLGELREQVLHMQRPGFSSMPLIGAKGIALHPGGNRAQGLIIAFEDPRYRPTGLNPGEFLLYAVAGADAQGNGGTTRPILKGTVDGNGILTGIEIEIGDTNTTTIVVGSNGNTASVDVYGKTEVTVHSPSIIATNGGTPSPVVTEAGPSTVLKADA
jgi:phage baseplate assembly protein V